MRVRLNWRPRLKKVYFHAFGRCIHFGKLGGRWSYGIDDNREPDPYGELEG